MNAQSSQNKSATWRAQFVLSGTPTICLCNFGLLCMSFVNVYEFVNMFLSILVLRVRGWDVGFDCINF